MVPLLVIYPDRTVSQKDPCTPGFIAGLFTITEAWEQPKCPSADEWIMKMCCKYTVECCSAIKNEIMPFAATQMDLEIIILVSQKETNTI